MDNLHSVIICIKVVTVNMYTPQCVGGRIDLEELILYILLVLRLNDTPIIVCNHGSTSSSSALQEFVNSGVNCAVLIYSV